MKIIVLILTAVVPWLSLAEVYYRPVPAMPSLDKPISQISDVITYSLVTQIHKGLFKKQGHQINTTALVKSFEVSSKGKAYALQLATGINFNDGTPVTAKEIKASLESALLNSNGHLAQKFGLGQVIQDSSSISLPKKWVAITVTSENHLLIRLSEPCPKLVSYLADPRMSVIKKGSFEVGVGDYKITSRSKDRVQLVKTENNKAPKFKEIFYYKLDQKKAIEEFAKGRVHDLSLYSLSEKQLKYLDKSAKVGNSHFPRTFAFFINSKRLSLAKRKTVAKYLAKADLVKNCKVEGQQNNSLIPKGFAGSTIIPTNNIKVSSKIKIKVMVPKGLGDEECIKKSIERASGPYVRLMVDVNDFAVVAKSWLNDSVDVFYGYIEGESDFSFFEHFLASSTFPLGKKEDPVVLKKYEQILSSSSLKEKHSLSKSLSTYLDNKYYYLPVYSPVVKSAYKSNLSFDKGKLQAPYQLEIAKVK